MSTVLIKEFASPELSRREILRYMGCRGSNAETEDLIDRGLELSLNKLTYKVCFCEFPIKFSENEIDLGFAVTNSKDLLKNLDGCENIVVFAATVGLELDRLILRHSRTSPSLAVCLQAIGAERIEALCDAFCNELKEKYESDGKKLRPRFSAGYGDLPIELQRYIFRALDCEKRIGLTLNDSMLMSPTKSVTAIVGIY